MSTSVAREPFTRVEFAFGGIAVAAIVLITLLGSRFSQPLVSQALVSQPVSQPPQDLPTIASPNAPTGARQWHPGANGAAREPPNQSPISGGMTLAVPPSKAVPDPGSVIAPNPSGARTPGLLTTGPALNGGDGAIAAAQPAQATPPDVPPGLFSIDQPPPAPLWQPTREASVHSPQTVERDIDNRSDARLIQRRLHELGYYSGSGSGVWGAASRNALRDFKSMSGLAEDDRWDRETEQTLLSGHGIHAASTFIGGWAADASACPLRAESGLLPAGAGLNRMCDNPALRSALSFFQIDFRQCQPRRSSSAPVRISSRGAETAGARCDFRSIRRATAGMWRIEAMCAAEGQSWHANVSLTLNGPNLTWSSERGSAKYVRCP